MLYTGKNIQHTFGNFYTNYSYRLSRGITFNVLTNRFHPDSPVLYVVLQ